MISSESSRVMNSLFVDFAHHLSFSSLNATLVVSAVFAHRNYLFIVNYRGGEGKEERCRKRSQEGRLVTKTNLWLHSPTLGCSTMLTICVK